MERGSYTENYSLLKPAREDFYSVEDFNQNADIIDTALKALADKGISIEALINGLAAVAKSGSYNDLTDKPDSLPADGGDADTLDGKHASEFVTRNRNRTITQLSDIKENGFYTTDGWGNYDFMPHNNYTSWTILAISSGDSSWARYLLAFDNSGDFYYCYYTTSDGINYQVEDGWKKVNDGGNADTVDGKHASDLQNYNNLTNKPESLPADGGNADTADALTTTSAGSATQPVYFSGGKPTATSYSLATSVPSGAVFTDKAVTQTATTTNSYYEVLFSSTADNTTRTEGVRKSNKLTFNPSTGDLTAESFSGDLNGDADTLDGKHAAEFVLRNSRTITKLSDIKENGFYYTGQWGNYDFMPHNNYTSWTILAISSGDNSWARYLLAFDNPGNFYYCYYTTSDGINFQVAGGWKKVSSTDVSTVSLINSNPIAISSIDKYKTEIIIKAYNTPNTANGYFYSDYTCTSSNAGEILQSAIDSAAEGSTVRLLQGDYNIGSPISVNKNLTIAGTGIDDTILIPTENDGSLFKITGGNVVFKDMKIQSANNNTAPLFEGDSSGIINGVTWENVYFSMQNECGGIIDGIAKYCRMINCMICKSENAADEHDIYFHSKSTGNIISNTLNMGSGYFNIWCKDDDIKSSCVFSGNHRTRLKIGSDDYMII